MTLPFVPVLIGCLAALASAVGVVIARRPIYAAIALLAHSLSLAGLFALLSAAMVAVGQIVIYSGAIVVLFLFVVTLLPSGGRELNIGGGRLVAACVAPAGLLVALSIGFTGNTLSALPPAIADPGAALGIASVGRILFGPLLVAFELTAPLLLVAVVGAVVIWRRHEPHSHAVARPVRETEPRRVVLHR